MGRKWTESLPSFVRGEFRTTRVSNAKVANSSDILELPVQSWFDKSSNQEGEVLNAPSEEGRSPLSPQSVFSPRKESSKASSKSKNNSSNSSSSAASSLFRAFIGKDEKSRKDGSTSTPRTPSTIQKVPAFSSQLEEEDSTQMNGDLDVHKKISGSTLCSSNTAPHAEPYGEGDTAAATTAKSAARSQQASPEPSRLNFQENLKTSKGAASVEPHACKSECTYLQKPQDSEVIEHSSAQMQKSQGPEVSQCNEPGESPNAAKKNAGNKPLTKIEQQNFSQQPKVLDHDFKDDWQLQESIAEGTSSIVYAASRKGARKRLNAVLKVARAEKAMELQREGKFLQHLGRHRNVVELFGFYHSNQFGTALALEFLMGGEVLMLVEHPCTEMDIMIVSIQVFQALEFIHSRGIVHRDLKADNVVFSGKGGEVKLVDFGLSAFESDDDAMKKRCGTPGYIAPEVIDGTRYSFAVDLFAAGVMIYFLIDGCLPFRSQTLMNVLRKTLQCHVKYHPEVWDGLQTCQSCVQSLLVKDFKARPTAAQMRNHPWFEALYHEKEDQASASCSDEFSKVHGSDKSISGSAGDRFRDGKICGA